MLGGGVDVEVFQEPHLDFGWLGYLGGPVGGGRGESHAGEGRRR